MSNLGEEIGVLLADGPNLDAFSRLRVSQNNILYTGTFDYDKRPELWAEKVEGSASPAVYDANSRSIALTLGTASGQKVTRQTIEYFRYATGNSMLIFNTFHLGPRKANVRKRVGYFDAEDGLFLEQTGTELALVVRSFTSGAAVDTRILQADWNQDTLDGSGDENNPSGATLDENSTQILAIDFQWLGVGRIRFYVDIDGQLVPIHSIGNANAGQTIPYMRTPNLPCRYEIENTGVAASGTTFRQICTSVLREGGEQILSEERSVDMGLTTFTAVNAYTTLIGIRTKATHLRAAVRFLEATVLNLDANDAIIFSVFRKPTVSTAGAVWVDGGGAVEYSLSNIDISAGPGTKIVTEIVSAVDKGKGATNQTRSRGTRLGADIDGVREEVWLAVRCAVTGESADCKGALTYEELR